MNRPLPMLLLALGLSGCYHGQKDAHTLAPGKNSAVFFVATNGNDHWSGTLPSPNQARTDGPFATLPHALQFARQTKGQIRVRRGTYFLSVRQRSKWSI